MKMLLNKSVKAQARRTRALERFEILPMINFIKTRTEVEYNAYVERKNVELAALKSALGIK